VSIRFEGNPSDLIKQQNKPLRQETEQLQNLVENQQRQIQLLIGRQTAEAADRRITPGNGTQSNSPSTLQSAAD